MKLKDLQKKTLASLEQEKDSLYKELMSINAQVATKTTMQNPGRRRSIKKTIARINTLLSQQKDQSGQATKRNNP